MPKPKRTGPPARRAAHPDTPSTNIDWDPKRSPRQAAPAGPPQPQDVLAACARADILELAEEFIQQGTPMATVEAVCQVYTRAVEVEKNRQREILAACQRTGLPEFAADLIRSKTPLRESFDLLLHVSAIIDRAVEIDGALPPPTGFGPGRSVDANSLYASRAGQIGGGK